MKPLIDVRSPQEFKDGNLPGAVNLPILYNDERHAIGLTYKNKGREAAIALGLSLTAKNKSDKVHAWVDHCLKIGDTTAQVVCWRGGLRSEYACQWMREAGLNPIKIKGGYKDLRRALLQELEKPLNFLVVTGLTGSGKTELLRSLNTLRFLDIEKHARHRGSAFGLRPKDSQPAQATFENCLLENLRSIRTKHESIIVEDESRLIGKVVLPPLIKTQMTQSQLIVLTSPMAERIANIENEYVHAPMRDGLSGIELLQHLQNSLLSISRKLGGAATSEISKYMQMAFQNEVTHAAWIQPLLEHYYDPLYRYGRQLHQRPILFEGDHQGVVQWLQSN